MIVILYQILQIIILNHHSHHFLCITGSFSPFSSTVEGKSDRAEGVKF